LRSHLSLAGEVAVSAAGEGLLHDKKHGTIAIEQNEPSPGRYRVRPLPKGEVTGKMTMTYKLHDLCAGEVIFRVIAIGSA